MLMTHYTDKVIGGRIPYDTNEFYYLSDFDKTSYKIEFEIDVTDSNENEIKSTLVVCTDTDERTSHIHLFLKEDGYEDEEANGYYSVLQWYRF